jgi:hypothetical protein
MMAANAVPPTSEFGFKGSIRGNSEQRGGVSDRRRILVSRISQK